MDETYLVLDQGSHASRAMLFDGVGHRIANSTQPIATIRPQPGWVEHDPEAILDSLRQVMAMAVAGYNVATAGLATQRSSIVCWNRNTGQALSPVISWQDVRAATWMDAFSRYRDDIQAMTGLFPSPHYGVSKLYWCLTHISAVKQALDNDELVYGPLASFLLFRLLDERPLLADPGNASRTLLWNMHTMDWDAHLLDMFALPQQALPSCVPSRHDFGHLEIEGQFIPVQVVMGDLPASLFASGRPQCDTAYINAGTGAFVQRVMHKSLADSHDFLNGVVYQSEEAVLYSLEGTVNGAGSAFEWFKKTEPLISLEEHLSEWLQREDDIPLFLNGVSGLGSPFWNPDFESRFVGEGEGWQQAVAVVESIVFLLQVNLEGMSAYVSPPGQIRMSGGLSNLDGFCQWLANLARVPVIRSMQSEATARGCAFLLAGCPDEWPETGKSDVFKPVEDTGLTRRYARWKTLMERSPQNIHHKGHEVSQSKKQETRDKTGW